MMPDCPNLAVPATVLQHVVRVESGFHPYAIGVVGGRLARQPRNLPEAVATARMLEQQGYNFSLGLAQVTSGAMASAAMSRPSPAATTCVPAAASCRSATSAPATGARRSAVITRAISPPDSATATYRK